MLIEGDAGAGDDHVKWELTDPAPAPEPRVPTAADDEVLDVEVAASPTSAVDRLHPGTDVFLRQRRAEIERIGLEAVAWADAASDALVREAEREAARIQADAVRRSEQLVREVERARTAMRAEARAEATRIWDESLRSDAVAATRPLTDEFSLPPISWRSDGTAGSDAPIDVRAVALAGAQATAEAPAPPAEVESAIDDPAIDEPAAAPVAVQPSPPTLAPVTAEPGSSAEAVTPAQAPRRRARVWRLAVLAALATVAVVGWLVTRSGDSGRESRVPEESSVVTTRPGAAEVDAVALASRWATDLAALAPAGEVVVSQGAIDGSTESATGEFAELSETMATDRTGGFAGTFAAASAAEGGEVAPTGRATVSLYSTPEGANRAFDAARRYFLGDRRTAAGNQEIGLPRNLALRSFGFRRTGGGQPTYSTYLLFPSGLVELTTTGEPPDALRGMVAVVSGWAA